MSIIFYRILGNDIPIRHGSHQTLTNLSFILKNEPELPGCEKRFLLNRIVDVQTKERVISMISEKGIEWNDIPFVAEDYRNLVGSAERILYLTNQNAARNRCIEQGLADSDVVMPFDGQIFFSANGFNGMIDGLNAVGISKYLAVPMFRLRENQDALLPWRGPEEEVDHLLWAEQQIIFRRGYDISFNESLSYGNANKIELLMKLGVKGPWDEWDRDLYRNIRTNLASFQSESHGRVKEAGFVYRLASGNWKAERSLSYRVQTRKLGLEEFISRVDKEHLK